MEAGRLAKTRSVVIVCRLRGVVQRESLALALQILLRA
jgi:hypothetical protein